MSENFKAFLLFPLLGIFAICYTVAVILEFVGGISRGLYLGLVYDIWPDPPEE